MPPNSPSSATQTLPRGILLVEEYEALGVAIASALRKFAPLYGVEVMHNFAEAEIAAAAMQPDLFVLDLDPPPAGEIEFFNKLQAQYPDARALVIAAGTSRELRAERGTAGAIQFIEKPFDLAEFGAAVQALLGPWAAPPSAGVRGTLRDLHVLDVIQLKCLAVSTAVVRVETRAGQTGEIHFQQGQIHHASAGPLSGIAALEEIVSWPGGKLSEAELSPDAPKTIDLPWPALLLQVIRKVGADGKRKSLGTAAAEDAPVNNGKKILVVDDTEMLLIFVADVLGTADQTFQILTASTGAEGLKLATSARPDLILLDYCLTDMNGGDVCRVLLANELTARIPVLMMSGRLPELVESAREFSNVVATLPKPFLSGALINTVEKVLAAGSLPKSARPKNPRSKAGSKSAPLAPPPAPAPPREGPSLPLAETLPNGKGRRTPKPAPVVRGMEVDVTLSLEVVSIQLTPLFRIEGMKMKPALSTVIVKMSQGASLSGVPFDGGFRLGAIELAPAGRIDTIRLIPTPQAPQSIGGGNSFAVGGLSLQPANAHQNVLLTAEEGNPMHVQLSARFELLTVELSEGLQVSAVLLKARRTTVLVSNSGGNDGKEFEIKEVQLDPASQLETLAVRAIRSESV